MYIEYASHSRLQNFVQCQYKYKLHYQDKLEPQIKNDYFEFGHFIHKIFELNIKDKLPLDEAMTKARSEFGNFSPEYNTRIAGILRRFSLFREALLSSGFSQEFTEESFMLPMDSEGKYKIKGTIDLRLFYENGNVLVVDYKTSKKHNQVSKEAINKDKQLMTYVWGISKQFNIDIDKISGMLFYVESGDKLVAKPNPRLVALHIQEYIHLYKTIENMPPENAKPNITRLCNYCEYREQCSPFKQTCQR